MPCRTTAVGVVVVIASSLIVKLTASSRRLPGTRREPGSRKLADGVGVADNRGSATYVFSCCLAFELPASFNCEYRSAIADRSGARLDCNALENCVWSSFR